MPHSHALNPSSTSSPQVVAILGAELVAYRVNRTREQRAHLLGLAHMAATLGALSTTDRAYLARSLGVRHA